MWHGAPYTRVNPFFFPLFRALFFLPSLLSSGPANFARFPTVFCHPHNHESRAAKLHLRRLTHPRASGRVYWLRRAGRAVERVDRAASGRSSWRDALDSHGAGPQDYTVSLFFFPTDSPSSLSSSFPPRSPGPSFSLSSSLSLPRLLSFFLSHPIVRAVGYNIQFIMYLWYMRTAAPEKWEARMHGSHRLLASPSGEK